MPTTTNKLSTFLSTLVASAAVWLTIQAIANILDQILPHSWSRLTVLTVVFLVAYIGWPVVTRVSVTVFVLAHRVFTGKWYGTQAHQRGA